MRLIQGSLHGSRCHTNLRHLRAGSGNERETVRWAAIFRYDTFGDEQLWTDVLRMHEAIAPFHPGDGARGWTQGRR